MPLRMHLHIFRMERVVHRVAQFALSHARAAADRKAQGRLDTIPSLRLGLAPLVGGLPLVAATVEGEASLRLGGGG